MDTPVPPKPGNASGSPDSDFEAVRSEMAKEGASEEDTERRARIEYLRSLTANRPPKKRGKTVLITLLVVVVVAALAAGVYWFFSRPSDKKASTDSGQNTTSEQTDKPEIGQSKHYDSTTFNLGFDYPENWKVTDEGDGKLTVASTPAKLKTSNGTIDAQVIFTVQSKQATLPGFKNGNGIAIRASEKIAYLTPTPNQRAQTYMTFVSFAGSATSGIDTVYITGDLGYQKDQAVPQTDIIQGDPLVSMYFAKCDGGTCSADPSAARVSVADSTWSDTNELVKAVKAVLTSLAIN
jgi:hypothetical protein